MRMLLTGDWQIRDTVPVCRTDDYFGEMGRKAEWIVKTAIDQDVDYIIHSGDLFDKGRPVQGQLLETLMMRLLQPLQDAYETGSVGFLIVPGNHDLPYHSMEYLGRSSLGVLAESEYVTLLSEDVVPIGEGWSIYGFPWGTVFDEGIEHNPEYKGNLVGVWHGMVTNGSPVPGSVEAMDLLRDFPEYDLIVTGHNHVPCVVHRDGRTLVNPGSMMRENIDQIDYKPAVFIYDTDSREVNWINIPIASGVISVDHKAKVEEMDQRIAVFVEQMKTEHDVGLSFEKNLENYFAANDIDKEIEKIVWEVV